MTSKGKGWMIALSSIAALVLVTLIASGAWAVLIGLIVLAGLSVLAVYLRHRGVWGGPERRVGTVRWLALVVLLVLLILAMTLGVRLYTDALWFEYLGYGQVFRTQVVTRVLLFFGAGLVGALFLGLSWNLALRAFPRRSQRDVAVDTGTSKGWSPAVQAILWTLASAGGVVLGSIAQSKWMRVLRFLYGTTVGTTDPLFGRDLGFYLFRLRLLLDVRTFLLWLTGAALVGTVLIYLLGFRRKRWERRAVGYLSLLGALFLLVKAWDYRLKIYLLLYSRHGAAFGASYTDVHARWPAYAILVWVVLGCALLLAVNVRLRRSGFLVAGVAIWLLCLVVLGTIYPALVQTFRVRPSELALESPYIENTIRYTLAAYALEDVQEVEYPVTGTLTLDAVNRNHATLESIRLWDHRPLYDTYSQLQEIRLYYNFHDIDVERYYISGKYREVELAVRELSVEELPEAAQTWQNRHLVYTHGYGVVMSPVNEVCEEGQPCFFIRDIPPRTTYEELRLARPEIYIGEETTDYVIVHTGADEFDYPKGDENVYTRYEGKDGVPLGGILRRLAFALRFGDLPILFSNYLSPDSRILFHRTVQDRVETLAPFLAYGYDPYPVILDGKLYWLQDAFTLSNMYPYSEPYGSLNYIRNSVKVVIDPYEGTTTFYVVDPNDPIVRTYQAIFPSLFRPVSEMLAGLRAHWRYPEDIFRIQSYVYATYHMRDPKVFYNKEDAWQFAKETYLGELHDIDSYYVIMRLPGWEREEFLLMVPFTPVNRDNLIAWMHAQCDGENYGRLGVFKFPKQSLVYGPFQIEARTNQHPYISQQLTLWNQHGSQVILGNLLVVPVEHSLLYVRPLYLQSETGQIPELRRVIVAYGNQIVMAETLGNALRQVLTGSVPPPQRGWEDLARSAAEHYRAAQECLRSGDWSCYGREMEQLQADLEELARLAEEQ